MQMIWCCWLIRRRFEEEAAEMEEWIGGKGIEGKCRENESHENVELVSRK